MYQLIVNDPQGYQKLLKVKKSGRYFDVNRVVWDERKHGRIPQGTVLGGLQRVEANGRFSLEVDAQEKSAHDAALQAIEDAKQARLTEVQQARAFLKALRNNSTMDSNVKQALLAIVKIFGREILD